MLKRKKAVSELMAIVIILAIVLAVGGFIFAWTFGLVRTGASQHEIQVVYSRMTYTTGSGWRITVVVKNIGTVTASDIRLTCTAGVDIYDNTLGGWAWRGEGRIASGLKPGQSYSHTWQVRDVSIGKTYSFRIRCWFSDGAYKEYMISVVAEQA